MDRHSSVLIYPEQHKTCKAILPSACSVTGCVKDLTSGVWSLMFTKCKPENVFSIALDESYDIKDTAQVAIFVRGITQDLEVVEFLRRSLQ